MKLKNNVCDTCKAKGTLRLAFKGLGFLYLSGVVCTSCGHRFKVKSRLKGMSLQYVDVVGKLMFLANGFYFILLGFYTGALFMVALVAMMNCLLYPLFFRIGLLEVDPAVHEIRQRGASR